MLRGGFGGDYRGIEASGRGGAVPKQTGEQGFYKVWVSDAPIAAE